MDPTPRKQCDTSEPHETARLQSMATAKGHKFKEYLGTHVILCPTVCVCELCNLGLW